MLRRSPLFALLLAGTLDARSHRVLHAHISDGGNPYAGVVHDGGSTLYGATYYGGKYDNGLVFRVKTDGSGYTVLHDFQGGSADGAHPWSAPTLDGAGKLYGTTYTGGLRDIGTVWSMNVDGSGFTLLHQFAGGKVDGASPFAGVTLDGAGNVYGTARFGGVPNHGVVWKMTTSGGGFGLLHAFGGATADGANPYGALVFDGSSTLYGSTSDGGSADLGTLFKIGTNGSGYVVLRAFLGKLNNDAAHPTGALALDGAGQMYGTTSGGGSADVGVVFRVGTNGAGYTFLHTFTGSDGADPYGGPLLDGAGNIYGAAYLTGPDGGGALWTMTTSGTGYGIVHSFPGVTAKVRNPFASLVRDGAGRLYGTCVYGGAADAGAVFAVTPGGDGYEVLHSFVGADGINPETPLFLSDAGVLYGTAFLRGTHGGGVVFRLGADGRGYDVVHEFGDLSPDGTHPQGALAIGFPDGLIYGTANGGANGKGAVFRFAQDGSGFELASSFGAVVNDAYGPLTDLLRLNVFYGTSVAGGTNDTGTIWALSPSTLVEAVVFSFPASTSQPVGVVSDDQQTLYGVTRGDATHSAVIYKVSTNGAGYQVLHTFNGGVNDGAAPTGYAILDFTGHLYGTTRSGGTANGGTLWRIDTTGANFTILHSFTGGANDGLNPEGGLVRYGLGTLYGTTYYGGASGKGTVYRISDTGAGFAVLHSFAGAPDDGSLPGVRLELGPDRRLYGTTLTGGTEDTGVEFATCGLFPGDANRDDAVDVSDVFYLINHLFAGGPATGCGGDVNGDDKLDVADVFYLINYLFAGGPAPV